MSTSAPTPPMIEGISPSRLYLEKLTTKPPSLCAFLCEKFPHILPCEWERRFAQGLILDEWFNPLDIGTNYEQGRTIYYYRFLENEVVVPFDYELVFENEEFMVVDKPHFLAVTPTGEYVKETLLTRLKADTNNANLSPIHRLDRETAGLILISKNPATRSLYQGLFAQHHIHKTYHAIAHACPHTIAPTELSLHLERGEAFYTMRVNPCKPANTHTIIDTLATSEKWVKYELSPTTGKLHQLRVHLNHIGTPIRHDPYYPCIRHKDKADFSEPLQLLAKRLAFCDPVSGRVWVFESRRELDF